MCILMCYGGPDTWVGIFVGLKKKKDLGVGGAGGWRVGEGFLYVSLYTQIKMKME